MILAICGSLRARSSNKTMLEAAARMAPEVSLYEGLETIPPFNPDLDIEPAPEPVARFRDADAVVFSSPEYAHGIPRSLKNALDWVVGSGELSGKPVTLWNASARGTYPEAELTIENGDASPIPASIALLRS
jgi:NAD(P)H-dependent FMN reductase